MAKVYTAAGHTGDTDPGAVDGKGGTDVLYTVEADLNLVITEKLNAALKRCGITVKTFRTGDVNLTSKQSLEARVKQANAWDADLYVEPHFNSGASVARGIETLYWHTSAKGKALAAAVQKQLETCSPWPDRGIKGRDDLYVLHYTKMPAIIPEYGFISNTEEERLVRTAGYQTKLTEATCKGICAWLKVTYKPPTVPEPIPPKPEPVLWAISSQNSNTIVLTKGAIA